MHFLVMGPCSHDLIVMSLVVKLIGTWFLDSDLSTCLQNTHQLSKASYTSNATTPECFKQTYFSVT